MAGFLRSEGIRLRDLIGSIRLRGGRDIFVGIGWLALALPFFTLAAQLGSKGVYGSTQPYLYPGLLAGRSLPLWAIIYSLSMWWIVWSPTEEMTYQAYALPRIQALSGRAWVAIVVVAFWWADPRLAIRGLALPGLPAGSDSLYVDLHPHPPAASAHRRALVVGRFGDSDHS